MEKKSLADYVKENGQAKAADAIGVHQTAISKAIRTNRRIFVTTFPDGKVEAEELRPFPSAKASVEHIAGG
ncbi:Cro/CI family transcriptional regulator [Pseudomonas aeruginosa]